MKNSNLIIRSFQKADLEKIYEICLQTGNDGEDATSLYNDKKLLGHYYAAPYSVLEPESTFILTQNEVPVGYILGTTNSVLFAEKCEELWFPDLRKKYLTPDDKDDTPDARVIRLIHKGFNVKEELVSYPAHLHIDILPEVQGMGQGKALIKYFIEYLINKKISGLHLEVSTVNSRAVQFYKSLGFHIIKEYEYSIAFGMFFKY